MTKAVHLGYSTKTFTSLVQFASNKTQNKHKRITKIVAYGNETLKRCLQFLRNCIVIYYYYYHCYELAEVN